MMPAPARHAVYCRRVMQVIHIIYMNIKADEMMTVNRLLGYALRFVAKFAAWLALPWCEFSPRLR